MKRISFLAFFTLLFMAVEMVTAFIDMWGHTNPRTLVEKRTELIQEQVETGSQIGTKFVQELNIMPADDQLTLVLGLVALIVGEVFAIGLKMKEEQDLTI